MTHKDEFTGRLEAYLDEYEGITPLPDAIRDAIRAELPQTKQTGSLGGRSRFLSMTLQLPAPARYGLVAAVVVVAVVFGASLLNRGGNTGNQGASPSPSLAASAVPTAAPPMSLLDAPQHGNMPAGDYYIDTPAYPARIGFSVPEGWWYFYPEARPEDSDVHAVLVDSLDSGAANGSAWGLAFGIVDKVRVDPCDSALGYMDPSVTESAEALATAFETWTDYAVTVEDASLGGSSGKRVEIRPTESAICAGALFTTPTGYVFDIPPAGSEPFENPLQFTFLDVNGSILVIWTTDYPGTNAFEEDGGASPDPQAHVADQAQLHDILDSIVITEDRSAR